MGVVAKLAPCVFLLTLSASSTFACDIVVPGKTNALSALDAKLYDLLRNRAVQQEADCSFVNGGSSDSGTGGPAVDYGNQRIGQKLFDNAIALVDCDEREAVILQGVVREIEDTSCGPRPVTDLSRDMPPRGEFRPDAGETFAEFISYADGYGMTYSEDLANFLFAYSAKDQVNLLCGCKVFYPDSYGAQW
jgi:hypothetical protein